MKKIIFVNSHPIQYFAPLYKYMNEQGQRTIAWYCSDETVKGSYDKEFGVNLKWDIPLFSGYEYRFFKNHSWKPSFYSGFFGLINFGMIKQLFMEPKSVVIVHGWNYLTHFLVLMLGKLRGHTICLRVETPLIHETKKKGWKQVIKRIGLKFILFPHIDYFLYIGAQNNLFYKSYGIADNRIIFCPYSIDNQRFIKQYELLRPEVDSLKSKIGIPATDKVILYSGKYIDKKRPVDLLRAFSMLQKKDCWLIMVGEGELRRDMEALIKENSIEKVILTGFVNQTKIAEYYALSDVFVMCSTLGETWGLSTNEAMNFNLPVILSDLTGSSYDLVEKGINGYVFETGKVDELTKKLNQVLYERSLTWSKSSKDIIKMYSFDTIFNNVKPLTS